jgi:polyhydroxyalkanoate synthesis regulator phasin
MDMVVSRQRIASAFLTKDGPRGSISRHARQRGVSRQRIYRESAWVHRQLVMPDWQAERRALHEQVDHLKQRVAELENQQRWNVAVDPDRQAEFACVGQGCGVSLPQVRRLLQVLLREETPSVAKLGRWTQAAGKKARALLEVLDEVARSKVKVVAADEIYTKAPVLMAVEPESLCWVVGQKTETFNSESWKSIYQTMPNLEMIVSDEGTALTRGVKLLNQERHDAGQTPVAAHLDHFHSLQEGTRGLGRLERRVKAALVKAEAAQKGLDQRRRQGQSLIGIATRVQIYWQQAEQAFDHWCECERAWTQAKAALRLVTPEGELNTPERAQQLVQEALARLPDAEFAKSKRQLQQEETYTYLKEVQRKLETLPASEEVKKAAVKQECLRRRPELLTGESTQAAAMRGVALMCMVALSKAGEVGQETITAVAAIFRSAWRASSLVECVNSAVRMQQARHRKLSQGLIDLKRLYWNATPFRTGPRRGMSPYAHLGVLPEGVGWWELIKCPPEQLRQQLSAAKSAD